MDLTVAFILCLDLIQPDEGLQREKAYLLLEEEGILPAEDLST